MHDWEGSAPKFPKVVGSIRFFVAIEFMAGCFFQVCHGEERKEGGKKTGEERVCRRLLLHHCKQVTGSTHTEEGGTAQGVPRWGSPQGVSTTAVLCVWSTDKEKCLLFIKGINVIRLKTKEWNVMYLNLCLFFKNIFAPKIFVFSFKKIFIM